MSNVTLEDIFCHIFVTFCCIYVTFCRVLCFLKLMGNLKTGRKRSGSNHEEKKEKVATDKTVAELAVKICIILKGF